MSIAKEINDSVKQNAILNRIKKKYKGSGIVRVAYEPYEKVGKNGKKYIGYKKVYYKLK